MSLPLLDPWEAQWAPYDEQTYAFVLGQIRPDDCVLEIGAGDLRLARRLAALANQALAWEIQPALLAQARAGGPLPDNLAAVQADARTAPMPHSVTVAVLLMRHCTHYELYVARLRASGCRRLITNARWRMGVEVIDLSPAEPFECAPAGWYTCRKCGALGYLPGDTTEADEAAVDRVTDVEGCPHCTPEKERQRCD